MSDELISVVMPVREVMDYTYEAIDSILAQTHPAIELLLIGQPHQESPIKPDYSDKPIRWLNREHPGIVGALNTGLAAASGEYIARMDDDDIAYPERLATQLDHLQQHNLDICGARVRFFNEQNQIGEGNQRYQQWLNKLTQPDDIAKAVFFESPIPHPTFFAPKTIWQHLGNYRDCGWPEDYDFILRAWQSGLTMGKPKSILLDWREHAGRLTYHDDRYSREAFVRAKASCFSQSIRRGKLFELRRNIWIAGTGRNARYWFDALRDNNVAVKGFVDLQRPNMKTSKRHRPVVSYEQMIEDKDEQLLIVALGNADARAQCIKWCAGAGMVEMIDFISG